MSIEAPDLRQLKEQYKETKKVVSAWENDIFWTLKKVSGAWISPEMVRAVVTCLCFKHLGINIFTPRLVGFFEDKEEGDLRMRLHNLGDRRIVTLIRVPVKAEPHKYMLNDIFLSALPDKLRAFVILDKPTTSDHDGSHENCSVCWKIRYREEEEKS